MRKGEHRDRLRHAGGLVGVEGAGQAGPHVAECARARAGVAHDHEGGVLLVPALPDIGTARFLAYRVQLMRPHDVAGRRIAARNRRPDPDPVGLLQSRRIGPMRLFGMARPLRRIVDSVEHDDHGEKPRKRLLTHVAPASQDEVCGTGSWRRSLDGRRALAGPQSRGPACQLPRLRYADEAFPDYGTAKSGPSIRATPAWCAILPNTILET